MCCQAVPEKRDSSCQTNWKKPCNAAVQYSARELPKDEAESSLKEDRMAEFINTSYPRLELTSANHLPTSYLLGNAGHHQAIQSDVIEIMNSVTLTLTLSDENHISC